MYNLQLETFLCVAECGSFNRAAEKLYISPPAVIKQINLLEDSLDLQLFVRTHRGLQLTEAGKSLAQDTKYIIQYCKDSITRAKNAMQRDEEIIRIGTSPMTPAQVLVDLWPSVLQTEAHPYSQEKELKWFLDKEGIKIQAWYPLGHGDKALQQEPLFTELAGKYGKSSAQIILRWHIQSGNIVIPGSKNPAHIKDNFDLFDFSLTEEEMKKIFSLDQKKRYYKSDEHLLRSYVKMVPDVDGQK